jgi:hypothetical protein
VRDAPSSEAVIPDTISPSALHCALRPGFSLLVQTAQYSSAALLDGHGALLIA